MPLALSFNDRWQDIVRNLNIEANTFIVNDESVYCTRCDTQLTAVSQSKILNHITCSKHLNRIRPPADPIVGRGQAYHRILNELDLSDEVYVLTDQGVSCIYCETVFQTITTQVFRGHEESLKHQRAVVLNAIRPRPSEGAARITSCRQNAFWAELCDVFILADIPLDKLRNPFFRRFLEKWMRHVMPDPTTLRDGYIDLIYEAKIQRIRNEIGDHCIALSVDETTDKPGRCVVNAVVTPLLPDCAGIPRLVHCDELDEANGDTIVSFVRDALAIVWPNGIHHDRVLVYGTDSARYMKRSARILQEDFPKMVNCTCVAHAWNLVAEKVRHTYAEADGIIANTKKVFRKAPNRVRLFREMCPHISLPPEPILTRWATWLEAAVYYSMHYHEVAQVIAELEPNAECVEQAQELFEEPGMDHVFDIICSNFSSIITTIKRLETRGLLLRDAIEIVETMRSEILAIGDVARPITEKMLDVFERNEGYATMKAVSQYLESGQRTENLPNWSEDDLQAARYAPIATAEIERTFSRFKKILAHDRESFTFKNVAKHVVINNFAEAL